MVNTASQSDKAPRSGRTIRVSGGALVIVAIGIATMIGGRKLVKPSILHSPVWWSVILWCLFSIYWSAAAKNSAPARKSETRGSRRVHEILLNAALLLALIPIPGLKQRFLPASLLVVTMGLAVQIASGMFGVWARRRLGSNWSGEITIKVDHRLIRTGPYRIVRHPIYTAMLGMFIGTAIVSAQVHALMGMALAIMAYWRKIRLEEANLDEAFGAEYAVYKRDTAALIPGLF